MPLKMPFRPRLSEAAARISLLICCFPGLLTAGGRDVWESRGAMTIERFGYDGTVMSTLVHEFALASSDEGFRIRAMTSWDNYEQGMLVVSDWKSLYQSNRVVRIIDGKKAASFPVAQFESAQLPNFPMYGWASMQALALANHLIRTPQQVIDHQHQIRPEFIPGSIRSRGREQGLAQIRTQCFTNNEGVVTRILFWGVLEGAGEVVLQGDDFKQCMNLGELEIAGTERALPTQMRFTLNILRAEENDRNRPLRLYPSATVSFTGKVSPADPSVFHENSYDLGENVNVQDHRFPKLKQIVYTVKAGQPLPFDTSLAASTPNIAQQTYATMIGRAEKQSSKRRMIQVTVAVSVLALGMVIFAKRTPLKIRNTSTS